MPTYNHKGKKMTRKDIQEMYNLPYNIVYYYTEQYDISEIEDLNKFIEQKAGRRKKEYVWPQTFKKPEIIKEQVERITQEYGKDNHRKYWRRWNPKATTYMNYKINK